jgi:hypothetical protein
MRKFVAMETLDRLTCVAQRTLPWCNFIAASSDALCLMMFFY